MLNWFNLDPKEAFKLVYHTILVLYYFMYRYVYIKQLILYDLFNNFY